MLYNQPTTKNTVKQLDRKDDWNPSTHKPPIIFLINVILIKVW